MRWMLFRLGVASCVLLGLPLLASAQVLGPFRWQFQPYCNVVTLTIVPDGAMYRVDGVDDQCGAAQRAGVTGNAFPNPDGTIGFGLTIVAAPGGVPTHAEARIALASLSGPWTDSAGRNGAFTFTAGAGTGGAPRPNASPVVYGGLITQPPGGTDRAISARVTADTGTAANAAAVYGEFGPPSQVVGVSPAGIRGDSNAETGVLGATVTGAGVFGFAVNSPGVGVKGQSLFGIGVEATAGPFFSAGAHALLVDGSIKAGPVRPPVFVHTSTPQNVQGDCTYIDNPLTNGDISAMLVVTHIYTGSYLPGGVGVYFFNNQWCIYRESGTAMPVGHSFNVLVVKR